MGEQKKSALIIANSQYEDAMLRQLVAPAQDAQALAEVLGNPAISGFAVQVLSNAPSFRVCEEIEAFFGDRERDHLLLLYFSGHGVTDDDGLLYFATANTQHKRLRSTAVAAKWVNEIMIGCRSQRQVLLLDCCHSGAFARTKASTSVGVGQQFEGHTREEGRGRVVLTASDAIQYSFEGEAVEGKAVYSVFTQALVQGLSTGAADLDGDGLITLDELYTYVHRRVKEQSSQQTPKRWDFDVDGNLVIAQNPSPVELSLPEDLRHAIESWVPEAREAAIRRLDTLLSGKHRGLVLAAHKALLLLAQDDSRKVSSAAEKILATQADRLAAQAQPAAVSQPLGSVPVDIRSASPAMVTEDSLQNQKKPQARPEDLAESPGSSYVKAEQEPFAAKAEVGRSAARSVDISQHKPQQAATEEVSSASMESAVLFEKQDQDRNMVHQGQLVTEKAKDEQVPRQKEGQPSRHEDKLNFGQVAGIISILAIFILIAVLTVYQSKHPQSDSNYYSPPPKSDYEIRLSKASDLANSGNVGGAIAAYREILRLTESRVVHARIAELLEKKGDKDGAIAEYRQVVGTSGNPGYYAETFALLHLLVEKNAVDDVYALAQRAVEAWPQASIGHFYLGWALDDKKDVDGAIAQYREAVRLNPKDASAHNNLGYELEQKGDRKAALPEYQTAAELEPSKALYQNNVKRLLRSSVAQKN